MTIFADIVTALGGVATHGGLDNVYPDAAPEDAVLPLVMYKRTVYDPVMTLQGYAGTAKSTFRFECWAADKESAETLKAAVVTAIEASTALPSKFQEQIDTTEEYAPETDTFVAVAMYSFWHA